MAPEQARAERDVDARADIYAVGIILYRCLAGQLPYEGATYNELMFKVVLDDPPPLDGLVHELDPEVVSIVHRALARERDERYPTARAFKGTLVSWLQRHGFPVSLAVVDLLQSGDRVGAELLQSDEAWGSSPPVKPSSSPEAQATPARSSEPPARPPAEVPPTAPRGEAFDGEKPVRHAIAFDGVRTARQSPLAKRDRDPPRKPPVESTDLIDAEALAAMSLAERAAAPRPVMALPDLDAEIATLERPAHRPTAEATTRMTAALSTPAPGVPSRATGATIAVGVAASVLLLAVLIAIGVASSDENQNAGPPIGPDARRLADIAARIANEALEIHEARAATPSGSTELDAIESPPAPSNVTPGDEAVDDAPSDDEAVDARKASPRPVLPKPKAPPKPTEPQPPAPDKNGRTFRREL
jgi:hypothetical protein